MASMMRIWWATVMALGLAACKKKLPPREDPPAVVAPAPAAPVIPAPVVPPPPVPDHPGTTLRVRAVVAKTASATSTSAIAMCRADEQLVGGSCSGYYKPEGSAVRVDGRAPETGDHTFGGGWRCAGDSGAVAQALCLSDSAGALPPVEK